MADDQAPIVTVPRSEAEGSVGRQIQEQWAVLHRVMESEECDAEAIAEAIRKLDALIGYDDAK